MEDLKANYSLEYKAVVEPWKERAVSMAKIESNNCLKDVRNSFLANLWRSDVGIALQCAIQ